MPVVRMAAKKTPSNVVSRSLNATYILAVEGSCVMVMGRNLEFQDSAFHRKMNT